MNIGTNIDRSNKRSNIYWEVVHVACTMFAWIILIAKIFQFPIIKRYFHKNRCPRIILRDFSRGIRNRLSTTVGVRDRSATIQCSNPMLRRKLVFAVLFHIPPYMATQVQVNTHTHPSSVAWCMGYISTECVTVRDRDSRAHHLRSRASELFLCRRRGRKIC